MLWVILPKLSMLTVFSVFTESLSAFPPIGKILFRNLFFKLSPLLLSTISLCTAVLFTNPLFTTSSFQDLSFAKLLFTSLAISSQPPTISSLNSKPSNPLKLGTLKILFIGLTSNISSKLFCSYFFSEVLLCANLEIIVLQDCVVLLEFCFLLSGLHAY